jgi:hypothetical protein
MIDESLLKSHFIGRDGFRWWLGQIAPVEAWEEQANHNGWGYRYKVRILGYHPLDVAELSNDDLPWAQVMFPTTAGSGAAKYAVNPKIRPGDMVIGFFLDGDNAQIPVIMGALGHTSDWSTAGYQNPFSPFTGHTTRIPNPGPSGRIESDESNEATEESQKTPRAVPPEVAARLREISAYTGIGREVVFADTTEDTTVKTIKSEVNNLLKTIQQAQGKISEYQQAIQNTAEVIKSAVNWVVGRIMDAIYNFLVGTEDDPGIIPKALRALYISVYGSVFAATGSPAAAHTAGYKSNEVFVTPIKILEEALSCVANAIVEGLKDLIVQLLVSLLENVDRFVTCVAEQFVGSLVNTITDAVADGLSSALGGVSALLGGAFNVIDFIQSTVDTLLGLGGLFDCNQNNTKGDGTKEWVVGVGPKNSLNPLESFNNIFDIANTIGSVVGDTSFVSQDVAGIADIFANDILQDTLNGLGECIPTFLTTCGSPTINIFGGGGTGATAIPILGSPTPISNTINNVSQTSNIIGAVVTNPGSGYRFSPFVEFSDSCGLGYGAKGRAVLNDAGEVSAIYMTSPGEGYPLIQNQEPYSVVDVAIPTAGLNYSSNDTATDNFGNTYNLTIDNGRILSASPLNILEVTDIPVITINSETGFGAVLKPILGPISKPSETQKIIRDIVVGIQTSVDCPT